ncbi:MAG: TatD family hydrolase [Pseudomonadota bacterium]
MLIDSHCHLHFPDLKDDLDDIVKDAVKAGLIYLVTISTRLSQASDIEKVMDAYAVVYGTTGVHPCEAYHDDALYDAIIAAVNHPKIVGLGETGLDYLHQSVDPLVQQSCFEAHIEAANTLQLPLIVHTREAEQDTLALLKKSAHQGVLHCFTGSYDMAKKALDMGFFISFSGILTYTSADDLRAIARKMPKDRVLVETDAPYLVPKAMRAEKNKINQPSFVVSTCQTLADVWGWSFADTAQQTTRNCLQIFHKLPKPSNF